MLGLWVCLWWLIPCVRHHPNCILVCPGWDSNWLVGLGWSWSPVCLLSAWSWRPLSRSSPPGRESRSADRVRLVWKPLSCSGLPGSGQPSCLRPLQLAAWSPAMTAHCPLRHLGLGPSQDSPVRCRTHWPCGAQPYPPRRPAWAWVRSRLHLPRSPLGAAGHLRAGQLKIAPPLPASPLGATGHFRAGWVETAPPARLALRSRSQCGGGDKRLG